MLQWLHTRHLVDSGDVQRRSGPSLACRHGSEHMHAHQFRAQGDEGWVKARKVQQRHDDQRLPVRGLQRARYRSHLHAQLKQGFRQPCMPICACQLASCSAPVTVSACMRTHSGLATTLRVGLRLAVRWLQRARLSRAPPSRCAEKTAEHAALCFYPHAHISRVFLSTLHSPSRIRNRAWWQQIGMPCLSSIDARRLASKYGWLHKRAGCDQAGGPFAAATASHPRPSRCQAARQPPLHAAH